MKPHKHAELIKAWADGAEIEYKFFCGGTQWSDWLPMNDGSWTNSPEYEYRIKPEPKPDVVMSEYFFIEERINFNGGYILLCDSSKDSNIKLTFDGETGKLKSAEVLK
jgi:hypothetical protein